MNFSQRFLAGFALAATIAKDPGAALARPGLEAGSAEPLLATTRDLLALSKAARRARVSEWMQPLRPSWPKSESEAVPLRAFALIAQRSGLTPGSGLPRWLFTAPLPRAGYTPEPGLVALLQRIAARRQHEDKA
jgi:hypothetical protein